MEEPMSESALQFLTLLKPSPPTTSSTSRRVSARVDELRRLVLLDSIPTGAEAQVIRPLVWKLFLRLHVVERRRAGHEDEDAEGELLEPVHELLDAESYNRLCDRGPSPMFQKIRNDTFRTLATDREFLEKVGEERLVRCLEAFVWRQLDQTSHHTSRGANTGLDKTTPYVQGMNVLAAPFLYVLPSQLEAFACFATFIENQAPRYVRPTLDGVHDGLRLVDLCLQSLDTPLYTHLLKHKLTAELYAFPSLLTLSACTPPLHEVLELWDFLLAWGVGLNVLCVVAQLWIMRADLLTSTSPIKLLRTFPALRTRDIIPLAVQFVADCPPDLFQAVMRHPWDDNLAF